MFSGKMNKFITGINMENLIFIPATDSQLAQVKRLRYVSELLSVEM